MFYVLKYLGLSYLTTNFPSPVIGHQYIIIAKMKLQIAFAALLQIAAPSLAADNADEIISLPGLNGALPSKHYSGYLSGSDTKKLHYWFAESENDPSNDPVVLWLNGGPGCSSLDGFLYEHGPFRVGLDAATKNATLTPFEYSWNKKASTLYIEAPVGVGFSYSTSSTKDDLQCDDDSQAVDNLAALKSFFTKFPEFASREFYITGESYGGIYVPTLAEAILQDESWSVTNNLPELKGIAVGNGCSGSEVGICSWGPQGDVYNTKYLMSSGFLPEALKSSLQSSCDFDAWFNGDKTSTQCDAAVDQLNSYTKDLDTYCVYCDCADGSDAASLGSTHSKIAGANKVLLGEDNNNVNMRVDNLSTRACINSVEASAFLQDPAVQEAIHVTEANVQDWSVCGTAKGWDYNSTRPNLPRDTYPYLINNIRVLIYNGDFDACVPYTDGEGWTSSLGLDEENAFHPWYVEGRNIGGYATEYKTTGNGSFEFITVKGGRHEVPETEPKKAFVMINKFLDGERF